MDKNNSPQTNRKAPDALRAEAERLRTKARLLDLLADETAGALSEDADNMLYALFFNARTN